LITSPAAIRIGTRLLRAFPARIVRPVAAALGSLAYYALPARRRIVLESLGHLAPNATPAERRRLARRTFRNLASASVDLFRLPSASSAEVRGLVESQGLEHVDAALAHGRGLIIVTSHLGPYELGGAWLATFGYGVLAVVEDLDADVLAALATFRAATGMRLVTMREAVPQALRALRDNQIVLLVADRAIGAADAAELPFAGGTRPIPTGPAQLALRSGSPLLVAHIARHPDGSREYFVSLEPPIDPRSEGSTDRVSFTRRVAARLAAAVTEHPDEWYVFQPEWRAGGAAGAVTPTPPAA
jgi:KDO2-lipid IV(A) lauroyltransferase